MNQDSNFIKVNNDLLASTALSSTQKLFISFVIGWQKNNRLCRMTNNNLAAHFGMKYAGIRTLLNGLNKMSFFETTQYGSKTKGSGWISGHELKVNEEELKKFLNAGKSDTGATSNEPEVPIPDEENDVIDINSNTLDNQNPVDANTTTEVLEIDKEEYEIEINAEKDTISSTTSIKNFVENLNGSEPNYIKAKVMFGENDFVIGEVVLATENDVPPKYIYKHDIEDEIIEQNKKGENLS